MSDLYQKGKIIPVDQTIDLLNGGNIVALLMSDSYAPSATNHDFIGDIVADELDADNYAGGYGGSSRQTPTNRTLRREDAGPHVEFDFDDITWPSLGGGVSANNDVVGYVVLAAEITNDSSSPLIAWDSLDDNRATNGSDIVYSTDPDGMFRYV
jgi:hypothetical protein